MCSVVLIFHNTKVIFFLANIFVIHVVQNNKKHILFIILLLPYFLKDNNFRCFHERLYQLKFIHMLFTQTRTYIYIYMWRAMLVVSLRTQISNGYSFLSIHQSTLDRQPGEDRQPNTDLHSVQQGRPFSSSECSPAKKMIFTMIIYFTPIFRYILVYLFWCIFRPIFEILRATLQYSTSRSVFSPEQYNERISFCRVKIEPYMC